MLDYNHLFADHLSRSGRFDDDPPAIFVLLCVLTSIITIFLIVGVSIIAAGHSNAMTVSFTILGVGGSIGGLIGLAFLALERVVGHFMESVTRGRESSRYHLSRWLFSSVNDQYFNEDDGRSHARVAAIWTAVTASITPLTLPVAFCFAFPTISPYVIGVGILVGGYFVAIALVRRVFDVSYALKKHKTDPNAHKNGDE